MMKKWTLSLLTLLTFGTAGAYDDCCSSGCFSGLTFGVDFLYWHACVSDLDYAIVFNGDPSSEGNTVDGKYRTIDHGWDPGVRAYLGYDFCNSCYGMSGSYTWFNTEDKSEYTRPAEDFVYPTLFNQLVYVQSPFSPVPGNFPTVLTAKHKLDYQSFDILFRYNQCCFGPCQVLHFFGGIEGVKIDQHTDLVVQLPQTTSFTVDWNSEFKGLGLKVGSSLEWNLQCGVGVIADASFSVVAGENDANNIQRAISQGALERSFKDCSCLCLPGGHLGLGIKYETCLCDWEVGVRAGYEFTAWWNTPTERRFTATPSPTNPVGQGYATSAAGGNIILHGLFAGAYVNF